MSRLRQTRYDWSNNVAAILSVGVVICQNILIGLEDRTKQHTTQWSGAIHWHESTGKSLDGVRGSFSCWAQLQTQFSKTVIAVTTWKGRTCIQSGIIFQFFPAIVLIKTRYFCFFCQSRVHNILNAFMMKNGIEPPILGRYNYRFPEIPQFGSKAGRLKFSQRPPVSLLVHLSNWASACQVQIRGLVNAFECKQIFRHVWNSVRTCLVRVSWEPQLANAIVNSSQRVSGTHFQRR